MLDNTKFLTYNQEIINRVFFHHDFRECKPKTNNYYSLIHKDFGIKLSLDFRKAMENGNVIGYRHLEINTSPHYHYNQYRHNGDDFRPIQATETIRDILTYLQIQPSQYNELKVVNIEFGINIIPETDTKNLINGLYFYKKTPFKVGDFPYFRKTDATSYKQIKAYAKGLQFLEFPEYGINPNTFRFEVKSKQAKNIRKYGINTANDLLNLETYNRLGQTLLDEWENILSINLTPDLNGLKSNEVQFIENAKTFDFWSDMIQPKYRNKFMRYKEKYINLLQRKNNLHTQIKGQIIDKLFNFQSGANSTQRTPINRRKLHFDKPCSQLINLESAPPHQNNRVCLVTGLDISMQKKGSRFLREKTLNTIKDTEPEIYISLTKKYLTEKAEKLSEQRQIYLICKNIRDTDSNPRNNRKRFEKRNYNPNQLQFNFN